jgi:hypothetical protein
MDHVEQSERARRDPTGDTVRTLRQRDLDPGRASGRDKLLAQGHVDLGLTVLGQEMKSPDRACLRRSALPSDGCVIRMGPARDRAAVGKSDAPGCKMRGRRGARGAGRSWAEGQQAEAESDREQSSEVGDKTRDNGTRSLSRRTSAEARGT